MIQVAELFNDFNNNNNDVVDNYLDIWINESQTKSVTLLTSVICKKYNITDDKIIKDMSKEVKTFFNGGC